MFYQCIPSKVKYYEQFCSVQYSAAKSLSKLWLKWLLQSNLSVVDAEKVAAFLNSDTYVRQMFFFDMSSFDAENKIVNNVLDVRLLHEKPALFQKADV